MLELGCINAMHQQTKRPENDGHHADDDSNLMYKRRTNYVEEDLQTGGITKRGNTESPSLHSRYIRLKTPSNAYIPLYIALAVTHIPRHALPDILAHECCGSL